MVDIDNPCRVEASCDGASPVHAQLVAIDPNSVAFLRDDLLTRQFEVRSVGEGSTASRAIERRKGIKTVVLDIY